MTDAEASKRGKKGAAFRMAKKQAADSGVPVYLKEYDTTITPEGNKIDGSVRVISADGAVEREADTPADAPNFKKADAEALAEAGLIDDEPRDPVEAAVAAAPENIKRSPEEVEAMKAAAAAAAPPLTVLARATWYVEHNGLSEDDALSLAQSTLGKTPAAVAPLANPGSPNEPTGPDAEMVAAYNRRMENYEPPKIDGRIMIVTAEGEEFDAVCPQRFLNYLVMSARWEETKRRREVNPADRLQMMLREYKRDDQDASVILNPGSATGPAGTFNPDGGTWSG